MPMTRPDAARPSVGIVAAIVVATVLIACSAIPTPSPTPLPSPTGLATVVPTQSPVPTPAPTPLFSNAPDPGLVALIPIEVAGQTVVIPAITEFAITPGDIGAVYGEIGDRFRSVQLAFVQRPRLSLYAMRVDPPLPATADLEPYLAEAGRYVGIAGLVRDAWTLEPIGDHLVWVRPEDDATAAGTFIYTWAADQYVFLLIGTDTAQNLAMLAALPGEAPPTPTPAPSGSADASETASGSPSPG